jgi:uncharacterized membrane protein YdfJ with MMPL/SSD domain
MIALFTDFASSKRGKWIIIAIWFVLTALIVPLSPRLDEVVRNESGDFLPEGAESTQVEELVAAEFPSDGLPAIIVFRNPEGLSDANRAEAQRVSDQLVADAAPENIDGVVSVFTRPEAASSLVSPDGTTMTMIANVTGEPAEQPYVDTIAWIRERATSSGDLQVKVSGPGGLLADLIKVFERIDGFLLLVTASLVLVLLVLIYRSPVVALVPLVSVGWVFSLAGALGALLAEQAGLPVNGQSQGIMTVLLFGAGTDYCLFVSSRYREELAHVEDKHEAMRRAMRGVGEAIASSAGTVVIATLLLLLAVLRSTQTLGPLLALAVGLMLVAALTLVPAILTVLGRWSFWPFRPRYDPRVVAQAGQDDEAHGIWGRIAAAVSRRPALFLTSSVVLFLAMSLGLLRFNQTYDQITALPTDSESREGFELLRQAFPAGDLAPTDVYINLPGDAQVFNSATLDQISQVATTLAATDGIASVTGPGNPFGVAAGVGPEQVTAAIAQVPPPVREAIAQGTSGDSGAGAPADPAVAEAIGLYAASQSLVSPDGNVAHLEVTLDQNPYSIEAVNDIPGLRDTARDAATAAGLDAGDVLVGGETATAYDTKVANDRDTFVVLPLILLAIGIVLGLLLRSVVAPIYLLVTTILSYAGTLGISTIVFQDILGQSGVGGGTPFFLFVFLVALGIDYNIFLMARIREETVRYGLETGTRRALGRTGGVITSAGIILAGTFAALMTLPLQDLFQLGFAVALGVLLETFVIRTLMVPSIVLLLGRWNWWPSRSAGHDRSDASAPAPAGD